MLFRSIYTFALLALFLYLVLLIVSLIFIAAAVRAFVQRNNKKDGLGIPNGVKGVGLVSTISVILLMVIWYLLFNEIAIITWAPP